MRSRRLLRDEKGGAVVEFALILPFMLLLLIGGVEVISVIEAQRRVSHVAYAIADLVAQEKAVTAAQVADVFVGGNLLMTPLSPAPLGQRIASFPADQNGVLSDTPDWVLNAPVAYAGGEAAKPPSGTAAPDQSVIVADVSYTYTPAIHWLLPTTFTFQKRAVLRPRVVDRIPLLPN
jgi:Flp pilus assembly protein TadG